MNLNDPAELAATLRRYGNHEPDCDSGAGAGPPLGGDCACGWPRVARELGTEDAADWKPCSVPGCHREIPRVRFEEADLSKPLTCDEHRVRDEAVGTSPCRVCKGLRERSGVPNVGARRSSAQPPSAWCWCGERADVVEAAKSGASWMAVAELIETPPKEMV